MSVLLRAVRLFLPDISFVVRNVHASKAGTAWLVSDEPHQACAAERVYCEGFRQALLKQCCITDVLVQGGSTAKQAANRACCAAVTLNANRHVTGVLRGFDQFMNIVLDNAVDEKLKTDIGMVVRQQLGRLALVCKAFVTSYTVVHCSFACEHLPVWHSGSRRLPRLLQALC